MPAAFHAPPSRHTTSSISGISLPNSSTSPCHYRGGGAESRSAVVGPTPHAAGGLGLRVSLASRGSSIYSRNISPRSVTKNLGACTQSRHRLAIGFIGRKLLHRHSTPPFSLLCSKAGHAHCAEPYWHRHRATSSARIGHDDYRRSPSLPLTI